MANQKITKKLKEIVDYNEKKLALAKWSQSNTKGLIDVEFEGMVIWNPLMDETMRTKVEPKTYYGEAKIEEFIEKYENREEK